MLIVSVLWRVWLISGGQTLYVTLHPELSPAKTGLHFALYSLGSVICFILLTKVCTLSFWLVELGEKVFLESGGWDEWQTFENKLSFDFEKVHELYNKRSMHHSFSSTCGWNMSPHGQILLWKQWFLVQCLFRQKY